MNLYEAIFKRKSIRNYNFNPLDSFTINDIEKYVTAIKPYNSNIKVETFVINDEKQVSGMFKIKAPHYIAITSEKKEDYLVNVGYILEQLVIYLTTKEIGTCWLGSSKPNNKAEEDNEQEFITMIAFGKSNEPLYRENINEFKRKDITEISNTAVEDNIMKAVKVAPSAVNKQSWYFEESENEIAVYCKDVGMFMKKMTKIDIGIAISHIYIAAKNEGKNIEFIKEKNKEKQGYEYIVTCKLI